MSGLDIIGRKFTELIVGITGNYCSGKNLASSIFQDQGYKLVDVDLIGHEALLEKKREIVKAFGDGVLKNGLIDRKKLGKIVFGDGAERKKLEGIVHPWMIKRVNGIAKVNKDVVIVAALLVEMGLYGICDLVIGIDVYDEVAVMRGMERDSILREDALQRLNSQIPLKEKMQYVDIVIDNNGRKETFERKVRGIIENIN